MGRAFGKFLKRIREIAQSCSIRVNLADVWFWVKRQEMALLRAVIRVSLQGLQLVAAKVGNIGWAPVPSSNAHDLLKAAWLSKLVEDGSRVLDVGGGNGRRLMDLSLYVRELDGVSIDVYDPSPVSGALDGMIPPKLASFDGRSIPYLPDSFDVVLICYVLHHLSESHAQQILADATTIARRKVILLEDSRPTFTTSYRLRNWAHATEANLLYEKRSADFARNFKHSFKTHGEWTEMLQSLPDVETVMCVPLDPISKYRHHTMFVADIGH